MIEFRDYDILLPDLVYDIVNYFRVGNRVKEQAKKTVLDYCNTSRFNGTEQVPTMIQPDVVYLICENLVTKGLIARSHAGTSLAGMDASYLYLCINEGLFVSKPPHLIFTLNCMAYGFRYMYVEYKKNVFPVITKKEGKVSMGACFRFRQGLITAKHCLSVDEVEIMGYDANRLQKGRVLVSNDPKLDLAYIDLGEESLMIGGEARILDEVLVMGYPKIPMFFDFCTAERAAISSVPTRGSVASIAEQFITPKAGPLMLVTARIRGGNSGGPVINSNGFVVGVSFSEPFSEGDYDDMGYGVAYPIHVLDILLKDSIEMRVNFVDDLQV